MNELAPIILFVYNRPFHTKQTVEALKNNELAEKSELFIYCDAAKNELATESVKQVKSYVNTIDGFKNVTIVEREKNWGLANSIIDGVTKVVNKYGRVIVLEDDLVTSPYFLKFMNDALENYKDKKNVWHISGWGYPIEPTGLDDVFLWKFMNCWGWATWSDKWKYFEKNTDDLISTFTKDDIKRFNLNGYENFWSQVLDNKKGKINTWAIYWYATIFKKDGLCLNPVKTFVENIGHDGSGENCNANDSFKSSMNTSNNINFITILEENELVVNRIQNFYKLQKKSIVVRIIKRLSRMIEKYVIK